MVVGGFVEGLDNVEALPHDGGDIFLLAGSSNDGLAAFLDYEPNEVGGATLRGRRLPTSPPTGGKPGHYNAIVAALEAILLAAILVRNILVPTKRLASNL